MLELWSGLGYYARARNLHAAARRIVAGGGAFPDSVEALAQLPGIGRSTAAAIAVFAFGRREAILDGNVKRVLARVFGVAGWPGERAVETALWRRAEALLPARDIETYTQALMDLGATLCTRAAPACARCPVAARCVALREGRVGELPAARPRRALPLRRARWLVALRAGRVLLVRRPRAGLWGGLWVFPEPALEAPAAAARRLLGPGARARVLRPALEHGFTHFRLRASVVLCTQPGAGTPAAPPPGRWLTLAQARRAALPAPVRRVLEDVLPRSAAGAAALSAGRTPRPRRAPGAAGQGAPARRRRRAGAG